ncbi:MAG: Clp protease ClpP, partial [Pseudonocardia sp.]|nr:Clp protease ClpP [Pseudonocardia sp.]
MRRRMAWVPRSGERPSWYRLGPVQALADPDADDGVSTSSSTADVYLFDVIGGWMGATAEDFVTDVASIDVEQLVVHLNSPGGDASEGVAIANVLRAHKARVIVRVDGMAASAASVVAMAGDEIVMGIGSQFMIHDAWALAIGDAADMAAAQRMLDSTSNALASTYAARAGGTVDEWRAVMKAETWYSAEEAVTAGLADRVAAADEVGTAEGEQITPGA